MIVRDVMKEDPSQSRITGPGNRKKLVIRWKSKNLVWQVYTIFPGKVT